MNTRKMFMDARLIHSKVSVEPTRICFPYDWKKAAEDDQTLVYEDVCNSGIQDFDDIADINVYAMIKPQTGYILCQGRSHCRRWFDLHTEPSGRYDRQRRLQGSQFLFRYGRTRYGH